MGSNWLYIYNYPMSSVARYVIDNPGDFKKFTADVQKTIVRASTNAVNIAAAHGRKNLIEAVRNNFFDRNRFIERQARYTPMPNRAVKNLHEIKATVGFTEKADFMPRLDEGGWHEGRGGKRLRIFTDRAREGGVKSGKVKRGYGYTKNARKMIIPLITKGRSHETRVVRRAAVAYKSGMLMYHKKSLYRITSFKRSDGRVRFGKEMIINREFRRTYTPPHDFVLPAVGKAASGLQDIFNNQMDRIN